MIVMPAPVQQKLEQALALHQRGQLAQALRLYEEILENQPKHGDALHLLGVVHAQTQNPGKALEFFDRALALDFRNAVMHFNRAHALQDLRQWQASLSSYDRAIEIDDGFAQAYSNRAVVRIELRRFDDALDDCDKAIALRGDFAEAFFNRGIARAGLRRPEAALGDYDRAIALRRDYPQAHCNRGVVLASLHRFRAAVQSYDEAIALRPQYGLAYSNRGNAQCELGEWDAALASFARASAIDPHDAETLANRGTALGRLGRIEEALSSYEQAYALAPEMDFLLGQLLYTKMKACRWDDFSVNLERLTARIERGEAAGSPFEILALSGAGALHRKAAEIWVREKCPASSALAPIVKRQRHERIRIGYFSADFREHPVFLLAAGLFETHDRSKFELTGFSFGPHPADAMTARAQRSFERFVDVRDRSDAEIALLSRDLEIDIAVDLGGFTENARPAIFALRAAPLQVSYLGFPGTLAAPYMDYLIADATIVPAAEREHYAERMIYLPSYQPNDAERPIADVGRVELGLPADGFVFCCFNASYKITPTVFAGWMRILERVPHGVLWLRSDERATMSGLVREAGSRGIPPERLVFAPRVGSMAEHLARYRQADLFLDTWPYGAHKTASDALWAGLPVLTCMGTSFASRVGASVLRAVGLPELIAGDEQRYVELAIELAGDARRLAELRRRLGALRLTSELFDTRRYTAHLEAAFTRLYERHLAGLPPEDFHIGAAVTR
jgi:predicted O-linked N-acetylglucosamine transferase (SPINDLY family)